MSVGHLPRPWQDTVGTKLADKDGYLLRALSLLAILALLAVTAFRLNADEVPVVPPASASLFAHAVNISLAPADSAREWLVQGVTRDLAQGDEIDVDGEGEAHVQFSDALLVRIFRDTDLRLDSAVDPNASPIAQLHMNAGTFFAETSPDDKARQRVSLRTPVATITDLGTRFFVNHDPATTVTWVVVTEGEVLLDGDGGQVIVPAGFQAWVGDGAPPVGPLPAARDLIGDRFPLVDDLTNAALADGDLLTTTFNLSVPVPVASFRTAPNADHRPEQFEDAQTARNAWAPDEPPRPPGSNSGPQPTEPSPESRHSIRARSTGSGAGSVAINGTTCDGCTRMVRAGSTVEFHAQPAPGSMFASWSGMDCAQRCVVTVEQDLTLRARFVPVTDPAPATVPSLINLRWPEAERVISDHPLRLVADARDCSSETPVTDHGDDDAAYDVSSDDVVISQHPAAGSRVAHGSEVTVCLGAPRRKEHDRDDRYQFRT